MKCQVDATQWGGSSRIFPWSPKPTRFSGGGSSRIFPWSPNKADAIQWGGGVVAEFFRVLQKPARFSFNGGGLYHEIFHWGALLHF